MNSSHLSLVQEPYKYPLRGSHFHHSCERDIFHLQKERAKASFLPSITYPLKCQDYSQSRWAEDLGCMRLLGTSSIFYTMQNCIFILPMLRSRALGIVHVPNLNLGQGMEKYKVKSMKIYIQLRIQKQLETIYTINQDSI